MARFRDVEEVMKYWNWYLYCLTYESWELNEEELGSAGVVRVPMDYIDLQVLATCLSAKIIVSHLDSHALVFNGCDPSRAPRMTLHLVHHKSRWAPLLGRKTALKALENQLVVLQGLEGGAFQSFKNKPAYVLVSDRRTVAVPQDVYQVNIGQQILPMQRHQLQDLVFQRLRQKKQELLGHEMGYDRRWLLAPAASHDL
eukprot:Skav219150  [mRNA]  locus=scaffold1574:819401:824148:- [translate_table: standard]